ncbi:TonB-dependent receptor [Sphingomonas ginkgonis]|uniref:TonB-dependent receptor n=1 Tax=Sphingomonas ginkgonis TaxID=2315330 RepID=A0A3R9YMG6_9SPHN|nr:TonB-dependent receptor [Sphingomonas ginkgonis]RST30845.1 TonB-dependent receptor [Sphingomonas ginkgonis]
MGGLQVKYRTILSATALQTGALLLFASGAAAAVQPVPAPPAPPAGPSDTTNSTNPADVIPVTKADEGTASRSDQSITVTGSRIRRPNLESPIPVTSIAGEQVFQRGQTNIGDALNDLPQLRSTFAQQNPGLGIGIAGLNLLDLRGLGTARTLVLVNGRRHVAADILNNAVSPDVNTIPNDLVERVDIVTGSNSAVYGSDAIAGVVNFVLKRDYNGLQLRGQGALAGANFGGNYYTSALFGKNFADGRGNITLHGEYSDQKRIFGSEIPWFRRVDGLGVIDVDTAGLPNGSDGFPDRTLVRDIRQTSISYLGLVPITQSAANPRCGTGLAATNGPSGTTGGLPYNCTYLFTPDGRLVQQTGTRYSTGIIGGILGGNGTTGREGQQLSVLPSLNRVNFNMLAHYTVSDAFEPFIEAKWNRVNALGNNAGPSFIQGTFGQFDIRERVRLDNPFLNPADRTTIANAILASGCNTSLTAACSATRTTLSGQGIGGALNAADITAINAGTYRFVDARTLLDAGIRDEKFRRDTYRIVLGARGTFNNDWHYELSGNYGKFKQDTTTYGYLDRQRFLLSLDSGRNPATGQIQCRSQYDPASATAFTRGLSPDQIAQEQAKLAADIAACTPYNPFGAGNNAAAVNYFSYNAHTKASLTQLDFLGTLSGDSSQLFELPGGPIGFSIGAEYRRERARYKDDPFVETGLTNAVVIGEFDPPTFAVKEAFGEINVPILKDRPFFHDLSLNGAGRVSDYKGAVGTVYTYNYGAEYAPVRDLRFRGNYGKAVRAPNVSETGFPVVPNFAPGFVDPCSSTQIGSNPNRQANCSADLGNLLAGIPNVTRSLPILSGSNPNLKPEVSHSLTLGGVLTPRFIPGFSLSVDYYNIKVKNVIVSLSAQAIVNGCYDAASLDNPFCPLFQRFRGAGTGPLGELPGEVLGNTLLSAGQNFAKRVRRGIDFNANYRKQLTSNIGLDTSVIYVHGLQSSNFQDPSRPAFEDRLLSELGDPKDEVRFDADLKVGKVTFGYRMHYIGSMFVTAYEDVNPLASACTPNGCPPNNADYADIVKYPAITYHDLRFSVDLGQTYKASNVQVYGGVDNVFDRHPPLGSTGTGSGSAIYDIRGRNFYLGAKVRF